ncbi:MAG: 30S ribosome-binding factor RbfA [Christensenellales bacterium]|jgi:ribosome-binding factor A|uniref:Ribosome-binding factor A n=1 Tax=Candidatus Avichristensenella intestinipullorum TaxID=2840693 RepID=A0A9D0YWV2_9FIRM|nr:30S ribosome-binding factor RbfA [Christensenellales bacterium]HIQ63542.1 30S ribosome-binding factor RbfA [Candidatus Avichristensenella intestinipullorum]
MSFERIDRISEEVRREVDSILREDVRDPRVTGTWSITRADVTRDLRYAKIRISVLEDELRQPMLTALKNAAGFIRHELGRRLNLRYTPEVLFEIDNNIAYGVHIASVLADVLPQAGEEKGERADASKEEADDERDAP